MTTTHEPTVPVRVEPGHGVIESGDGFPVVGGEPRHRLMTFLPAGNEITFPVSETAVRIEDDYKIICKIVRIAVRRRFKYCCISPSRSDVYTGRAGLAEQMRSVERVT